MIDAADALHGDFERVGGDLGEHRLEPLPDRGRADMNREHAVGLEHQPRAFLRPGGTALDEAAEPEPVIASIDQLALQLFLFAPADLGQAAFERDLIVTAIERVLAFVGGDGGDAVRHLGLGHEIAPSQLDSVDAQIGRRHVDEPLAKKVGLEAARPPIGPDRGLVGQLQRHVDVDVGNTVGPGHELCDVAGADGAVGAHVGTDVRIGVAAQRQDGAVAGTGDLDVAFLLARMIDGHQLLAPVLDPLYRSPHMTGRERDEKILRIELAARPEAAADIVLHHVDRVLGETQLLGQRAAVEEQHLGGAMDGEPPARRIPLGQEAARLHRQRHMPLHPELLATRIGGLPAGGGGIAQHRVELDREVAAGFLEQKRVVACRGVPVRHRRQLLDRDLDRLQGVLGDAPGSPPVPAPAPRPHSGPWHGP